MSIKNSKTPPIILRLLDTPFSAIENLIQVVTTEKSTISQPNIPVHTEEDMDKFILAQFIMYLYIKIFVFPETSFVYNKIVYDGFAYLKSQLLTIKDKSLQDLIKYGIDLSNMDSLRDPQTLEMLESVVRRIRPTQAYPNLNSIISIVLAIYGRRTFSATDVIVHRITLQKIEGYDDPTFVLSPCFETRMDTAEIENLPSLFWKMIFSFRINEIEFDIGDLTGFLQSMSLLALPLDPGSVMRQMQKNAVYDNKTGVPFVNYMAMYFRERAMGLDYNLSPFADARRILMMRAHQFYGFGGTYISDYKYASTFLNNLKIKESQKENDFRVVSDLLKGRPDASMKLTKGIYYEEALEAAKPKTDQTKNTKKPAASKNDDDAFADDSDTLDTSNQTPQSTDENTDDNIDRTSDVGQDSAAANVKVFLPLALPTETIDDHLLRLMLLRYVDDMDKDPSPDITPENLESLKYWCDSWLFIASIDQTKKLLAQLNLTGQLKELVI